MAGHDAMTAGLEQKVYGEVHGGCDDGTSVCFWAVLHPLPVSTVTAAATVTRLLPAPQQLLVAPEIESVYIVNDFVMHWEAMVLLWLLVAILRNMFRKPGRFEKQLDQRSGGCCDLGSLGNAGGLVRRLTFTTGPI